MAMATTTRKSQEETCTCNKEADLPCTPSEWSPAAESSSLRFHRRLGLTVIVLVFLNNLYSSGWGNGGTAPTVASASTGSGFQRLSVEENRPLVQDEHPVDMAAAARDGEDVRDDEDDDKSYSHLFLPHLPIPNNEQYRRICAPVHSSILCMTLRFPFPVQPQDSRYEYPRPVDERFYDMEQQAVFVEGSDLIQCQNYTQTNKLSIERGVQLCLDRYILGSGRDPNKTVVSVWTRRRLGDGEFQFYGTRMNSEQKRRIDQFFGKNMVLVMGASPSPPVAECIASLFGGCHVSGLPMASGSKLCSGHGRLRRELRLRTYQSLPLDMTYIGYGKWLPRDIRHARFHKLPTHSIVEALRDKPNNITREAGFTQLRKLSLIIEYPIAHVQNQNTITEDYASVEAIQKGFPNMTMFVTTEQARTELAEMGYELEHLIVFDGIPQFNPTRTGAYDFGARGASGAARNESEFLRRGGYPGWIPAYGSNCRGPLPPSSPLTAVHAISRAAFAELGHDTKFYGQIWEFANQFWYQTTKWNGYLGQLDCTHASSNTGSGMSCVHKYFLMAMVDDHFDNLVN